MLYAVLFEDEAAKAGMRARHMPEHLAFLERNAAAIRAAGPLLEPDGRADAGGLWLVEADSAETVRALCRSDPFWPTGLRKSLRILEWKQVFSGGKRLI